MSADWQRGFSWFAAQNDRATSRVLSLQRRGQGRSSVWPVRIQSFLPGPQSVDDRPAAC